MAKLTFGATCGAGPALGIFRDQVIVCWPGGGGLGGAQPNYKLNLLPVFPDEENTSLDNLKVLNETSTHRPAVASFQDRLFIAWTGTDATHRVNIISMPDLQAVPKPSGTMHPPPGVHTFDKVTLGATAVGGPSLTAYNDGLLLAFCGGGGAGGGDPNGKINIAWSADGLTWEFPGTVLEHQTSFHSPAVAPFVATSGPDSELLLAWTGTDQHLYVNNCAEKRFDQLDDHVHEQAPPESSEWGPAMASFSAQPSDWSYIVVWTGTDQDGHLYESGGGGNNWGLAGRTSWTDTSAFEPAIVHHPTNPGSDAWVYAWAGRDAVNRLNVALRRDLVDRHVPQDDWYKTHSA
jgi:hypothetical protein